MTYKVIDWQEELKPFWAKTVDVAPHPHQGVAQALQELDRLESLQVLISMAWEQTNDDDPIGSPLQRITVLLECYQSQMMCCLDELRAHLKS